MTETTSPDTLAQARAALRDVVPSLVNLAVGWLHDFLVAEQGVNLLLEFGRLVDIHLRTDLALRRNGNAIKEGDDEVGLIAIDIYGRGLDDVIAQQRFHGLWRDGLCLQLVAHHVAGDGDWGIYNSAYVTNPFGKVVEAKPGDFHDGH